MWKYKTQGEYLIRRSYPMRDSLWEIDENFVKLEIETKEPLPNEFFEELENVITAYSEGFKNSNDE